GWPGLVCAEAGVASVPAPAQAAAAPPPARNALLRKMRRSASRSSRSFCRWSSKSGQFASSPLHIVPPPFVGFRAAFLLFSATMLALFPLRDKLAFAVRADGAPGVIRIRG